MKALKIQFGMMPVVRSAKTVTNETDGFFRQARLRLAAVWGIRQEDATTHGGKRRRFMSSVWQNGLLVLSLTALVGCSTVPSTNVHQPMSVRPVPAPERSASGGAIYQASYSRPLFEDRRARNIGDVLTINIVESTSASKNVSSTAGRTSSVAETAATPTIFGYKPSPSKLGVAGLLGGATNFDSSVTASGAQKFEGKGDTSQKNALLGILTVTVIDILPNGNLLVSGEKQMGINEGTEYVRFSGVVNPSTISSANVVSSTQVADARIEFKGRGEMDSAQAMGWMTRFFLSVLPF